MNYYVIILKYKNSYKEIVTFHVFVCKGGFFFFFWSITWYIQFLFLLNVRLDRTYFAEIEN